MATNPTSVNASFAFLEARETPAVGVSREARLAIRLGTTSLPGTTDTDLNDQNAVFASRNTDLDLAWRLSTRNNGGAIANTGTVGCGFFLFRDDQDGGGAGTNRVKFYALSNEASRNFPAGSTWVSQATGTTTIPAADLVQAGSYKIVPVMWNLTDVGTEDDTNPPQSTQVSASTNEFYCDADNNENSSTGVGADPPLEEFITGRVGWVRVTASAASISTSVSPNQGYTDAPTITIDVADAFSLNNPKQLRVGPITPASATSASLVKSLNVTPSSAGAATSSSYNVDTLFPQAATTHKIRVCVGPVAGQSSTLTAEKPDVIANNTESTGMNAAMPTGDRAWIAWATPAAGITKKDDYTLEHDTSLSIGYDVTIRTKTITSLSGATLYMRAETFTADFTFNNVHGTQITPGNTTTLRIWNSSDAQEGSSTDTTSPYTVSYTIGNTDTATWDLTGSQKHLNVLFAHYGANDPTFNYNSGTGLTHLVSRKWQMSTSAVSINGGVFTSKTASPSSDTHTTINRGQELFFNCYIYNARGELLASPTINFNVRPTGSETYDVSNATLALSSGQFTGASAKYTVGTDDAAAGKTLVIASQTTASANHPRTGTGGSGNFAESPTGTPEWTVSSTFTVTPHLQIDDNALSPSLNTTERLVSSIGYFSIKLTDANGDAVNGASGTLRLQDDLSQVTGPSPGSQTTATVNGNAGYVPLTQWTDSLPSGLWDLFTSVDFTLNGNTGTLARPTTGSGQFTLVASDPNIRLLVAGGPSGTDTKDTHFSAGIAFQAGIIAYNSNTMKMLALDSGTPKVAICRLQDEGANAGKAEYLDSDLTWKVITASTVVYFWECTETVSGSLVYVKTFTTANTTDWDTHDIFIIGVGEINGNPYSNSSKEISVSTLNKHDKYAFDGVGFAAGFPFK